MTKKILITGATGLVGAATVKALQRENTDHTIIALSSRDCDLSAINADALFNITKHVDCVIHCAASLPHHTGDEGSGVLTRKIDRTVFEYCQSYDAACLYMSGCSLYNLLSPDIKTEQSDLNPKTKYHDAKVAGERLFLTLPNTVIARISSPYASTMVAPTVLKKFITSAQNGDTITVYNQGFREQDFVHVDDIADFIVRLCRDWHGGVYNVASGHATRMTDLAKLCLSVCRKSDTLLSSIEMEEILEYARFNINRAHTVLGWKPRIDLDVGIKDFL